MPGRAPRAAVAAGYASCTWATAACARWRPRTTSGRRWVTRRRSASASPSTTWAWNSVTTLRSPYEYLPEIEKLEKVTKLSGAPDLILIHSGTTYQRRVILNSTRRVNQLRLDVGRRLGRAIFFTHPFFVRPLVRRFGKRWNPYNGTGLLDDFIDRAEAAWPKAKILVIAPFPNSSGLPHQRREIAAPGRG